MCECEKTQSLRDTCGLRARTLQDVFKCKLSVVGSYVNEVMKMYDDIYSSRHLHETNGEQPTLG